MQIPADRSNTLLVRTFVSSRPIKQANMIVAAIIWACGMKQHECRKSGTMQCYNNCMLNIVDDAEMEHGTIDLWCNYTMTTVSRQR